VKGLQIATVLATAVWRSQNVLEQQQNKLNSECCQIWKWDCSDYAIAWLWKLDSITGEAGFAPSLSFYQCSVFVSMLLILIREGRAGEACESSNKAVLFPILCSTGQKSSLLPYGAVSSVVKTFPWLLTRKAISTTSKARPWHRRLVAGHSPWRPGIHPSLVRSEICGG
jgi:hypothetical protein